MLIVPTLWWLSFWTAVGLCVGSFLNAVIYRIPRGKSMRSPIWSACPFCRFRIAWYDNIPIVSFLLLRGRCRKCDVPIPTRYLLIEALMAVIVLMLVDAFLVGQVRSGLSRSEFGLTDRLAYDWPLLVAHVILFACLLAMSAIDLEHYWVDIRFTNFVTVAGFALHTLWTPRHSVDWPRPSDAVAVMSVCALAGLGLVWTVLVCQPHMDAEDFGEPREQPEPAVATDDRAPGSPPPSLSSPSRVGGWISLVILMLLFADLFLTESHLVPLRHAGRAIAPLLFIFVLVLSQSIVLRESDQTIVDAIDEERSTARRMVLEELAMLAPAILLALIGLWVVSGGEHVEQIRKSLHASARFDQLAMFRRWAPLEGFCTAAAGYIISGALGWAVRIVFTLAFGKEAFGTGDIHMMAAAGCVAGWPVVVLGFFLTCGLALAGWLIALPFKRTRALPLGPWLSFSFLIVVVFYEQILQWPILAHAIEVARWLLGVRG